MPFVIFVIATLATLAICWKAMAIGTALKVLDAPDAGRKRHARITPLVGGLAIIVPLIFVSLCNAWMTDLPMFNAYALVLTAGLLLGFRDDRKHIPAMLRLAVSVAIGVVGLKMFSPFEIQFLRFSFIDAPIFTGAWGLPFTVLCLVGLQNAVNMADGKNGLVIGLCFIWTSILVIYAPPHLYPLLATLLAGLLITLAFNLSGRLFLGDAGAYGLSFAVAMLTLYIYNVNFSALSADMIALFFLIPVVDCLRLMIGRSLKGRSPFSADREHLHHILLRFMSWEKALVTYLAMVFLPAFMAIWMPDLTLLCAVLAAAIYAMLLATAHFLQLDQEVPHRTS
jgi:UDP-GlcNAc:undecaprenyl-phosphate GlcNAc-1-phosphate transferase